MTVISNPVDTLTTEYYEENNTGTAFKVNLEENIGQEAGNHFGSYCNPDERYWEPEQGWKWICGKIKTGQK